MAPGARECQVKSRGVWYTQCWVTWGKLLNPCEPPFFSYNMEICTYLKGLLGFSANSTNRILILLFSGTFCHHVTLLFFTDWGCAVPKHATSWVLSPRFSVTSASASSRKAVPGSAHLQSSRPLASFTGLYDTAPGCSNDENTNENSELF